MVRVRKPSFRRPSLACSIGDCEAPPTAASRMPQRRNKAVVLDKEGRVEPEDQKLTNSEDSGVTLL